MKTKKRSKESIRRKKRDDCFITVRDKDGKIIIQVDESIKK